MWEFSFLSYKKLLELRAENPDSDLKVPQKDNKKMKKVSILSFKKLQNKFLTQLLLGCLIYDNCGGRGGGLQDP